MVCYVGEEEVVGVTIKEHHEGDLYGDGISLYLDSSHGYMNLHM